VEQITALVILDHPTWYGGTPSALLDSGSCGDHTFHHPSLVMAWRDRTARRLLVIALISYAIMRVWSALFFIPEMLAFQKVPLDSAPSAELTGRVARWTFWTWFREPLDITAFLCSLLALYWLKR
jgi:hypothetical protein